MSDIPTHASILLDGMATGSVPWYTIWYGLLYVATLGQATSYDDLRLPAVVILSLAMGAKAAVTLWAFSSVRDRSWRALVGSLLTVLFVMLVVPLHVSDRTEAYLGKVTPTIWHNPTTMLLMPVSVVLFVVAVDVLRRDAAPWPAVAGVAALLALDLAMKPNFGLAFLPVLGIYAITLAVGRTGSGRWRPVVHYVVLALVGVIVLGVQYWGTYGTGAVQYENVVDPFQVWHAFTSDIPLAVTESLLLPVAATIVLWRGAVDRTSIVLAWSCTALAVATFALLSELDPVTRLPVNHGNWSWGMQAAMFVMTVVLVREWLAQQRSLHVAARVVLVGLAAVQLVTGVAYLHAMFTTGEYT